MNGANFMSGGKKNIVEANKVKIYLYLIISMLIQEHSQALDQK